MDYDPDNARDPQYDDEQFDDGVDEERTLFGRVNFVGDSDDAGLGNVYIEFVMDPSDHDHEGNSGPPPGQGAFARVNPAEILQFLAATGLRRVPPSHAFMGGPSADPGDEDEDEFFFGEQGAYRFRRHRRNRPSGNQFPEVPSENGQKLMASGVYGSNPHYLDTRRLRKKKLSNKLMWRELGVGGYSGQKRDTRSILQDLIPGKRPDKILHYDSRCYSGQFSEDGNFFFCCSQDFRVRLYDTSNPYEWKYYKAVSFPFGQWTITDATLSPDNRYLAFSSMHHEAALAPTDPNDSSEPILLDFGNSSQPRTLLLSRHFGIFSLRFSGDGREVVAGTSDRSVIVYDLERRQSVLRLQNHEDDVNAVCFGDKSSPHILYSGSDDTTIRVWDRRSMSDRREAGAFVGHTEGVTYVDSKGDGRYVLSNGKDQSMKLWDLRKMMSTADFDKADIHSYTTGFDYRFMSYLEEDYTRHPQDCSVVTFRGHRVLKTLIRCHFSPPGSTNSRYVYTGSSDGKVYVYNLDGTKAAVIDVQKSTRNTRPRQEDYGFSNMTGEGLEWKTCVRDASWHPYAPVLAATSWDGWGMSTGTTTLFSWGDGVKKDEGVPHMGMSYDSKVKYHSRFSSFTVENEMRERVREFHSNPMNELYSEYLADIM
ncbi:hypothetical protein VTN49DRAFT_5295 [Thermomyces lanuginosus]|uniref:uncharacterized protein n=1 Tax=Thermomyces lanuginosus TaxID=5541 RepID=UPI0037434CBF